MNSYTILAFFFYFAILLFIGLASYRKQKSSADFIVGNRSLNFWVIALSAHASDMSSWLFMAFPAALYIRGISQIWMAVGLLLGMWLTWQFVAIKLRTSTENYDSYTLPSFFSKRFNDTSGTIRTVTALMSVIFLTSYLSAGLMSMGLLLESIFGIDYYFGERAADVEATLLALGAAGWQTEWTLQKVMSQVFEKSYALIYAQDALEAYLISLEDAKKVVNSATKLNQAGLKPISDVYSSNASLAQIQIDVIQQRSQLRIQKAKLATTLGLDVETELQLASIDAVKFPQQSLSGLIQLSKEQRKDLMAQRARVAEAIALKKKVDARYRPNISRTI
jgi:sodium/proline symporter